jgi:signal transduction histidine kinase
LKPIRQWLPRHREFLGLAILTFAPVVVLAALAIVGLRAQRGEVLADAHRQAGLWIDQFSGRLSAELRGGTGRPLMFAPLDELLRGEPGTRPVRQYADPPLPTPTNTTQHAFAEAVAAGDHETLRELVTSDELSAAGLPIGALAAREVWKKTAGAESDDELLRTALVTHPSIITPLILDEVNTTEWQAAWARDERARAFLRTRPDPIKPGPVVSRNEVWWIISADDEGVRLLTPDELRGLVREAESLSAKPPWAGVSVRHESIELTGDEETDRRPVAPALAWATHPLTIAVLVADEPALFAPWRRQMWWAVVLLGTAIGGSGLAFSLMVRALDRERRLNELKSQFVSSVSHELRAPIASLRLMAEALESGKVTGAGAVEFFRLMAAEGARLSALIENVLDFARIEQGRKSYTLVETEVAELVGDAVRLFEPQAAARKIHLQLESQPLPFVPLVDAAALRQAVINLIDNAIKFSPAGSSVTVRLAARPGGEWEIVVADDGIGIPSGEHERIFERFYRLGNELRRETQGAGIGLSLVKHIVWGHGGRVEVRSAPGKGSTFSLIFCGSGAATTTAPVNAGDDAKVASPATAPAS